MCYLDTESFDILPAQSVLHGFAAAHVQNTMEQSLLCLVVDGKSSWVEAFLRRVVGRGKHWLALGILAIVHVDVDILHVLQRDIQLCATVILHPSVDVLNGLVILIQMDISLSAAQQCLGSRKHHCDHLWITDAIHLVHILHVLAIFRVA